MAYIGVDLHSDNFRVCWLEETKRPRYQTYTLTESGLTNFIERLSSDDEIAVEAMGNSSWFYDQVSSIVARVIVVNPREFKIITQSVKKTDTNDAHRLAFHLMKGMLPSTRIKSAVHYTTATLVHGRQLLIKQRTALINAIHGQFIRQGIRLGRRQLTSPKQLRLLDLALFDASTQRLLEIYREQIFGLNRDLKSIEDEITAIASGIEGYEGLLSITGIGPLSAAILLAEIGDIGDFETADKLAAYFGIVPRIRHSNEMKIYGRITKRGNKIARTALIQCTWITILYSDYLRANYERIKATRGSQKAIVATARKLLRIIYDTLKNDWVFEDFTQYKLRQ